MQRLLAAAAGLAIAAFAVSDDAPAPTGLPVESAHTIATFPHDPTAFTEGLLIDHGTLYESTGEDRASIRRVDLPTGRVLASVAVPDRLFGEGIVAWGKALYSVTWHGGRGFRWSLPGLVRTGGFSYTGEGWAMTQDGHAIILSDGTPVLRFLDPKTLKVRRQLTVTAEGVPLRQINELEYVNGEILANVWMTTRIARIDPKTGRVKGWIDLSDQVAAANASGVDSVANGIAYDAATHRLFVTGKNWPTLFEIALPKREAGSRPLPRR